MNSLHSACGESFSLAAWITAAFHAQITSGDLLIDAQKLAKEVPASRTEGGGLRGASSITQGSDPAVSHCKGQLANRRLPNP